MNDDKMDIKEAYLAMYRFLENEYELTGSDDIGGLLGGMSFLADGSTADPSAWENWLNSIEEIKQGNYSAKLIIKPEQ
jgi:hypothetical protein